jgi:hypothetical protein
MVSNRVKAGISFNLSFNLKLIPVANKNTEIKKKKEKTFIALPGSPLSLNLNTIKQANRLTRRINAPEKNMYLKYFSGIFSPDAFTTVINNVTQKRGVFKAERQLIKSCIADAEKTYNKPGDVFRLPALLFPAGERSTRQALTRPISGNNEMYHR